MVHFQQKKMKMQSLIIHDLCTTGESSYFICGTKWTCTQPLTPSTEWEHKLQQHLSQVMVHMVAVQSIKQKQNFQHLLKHTKKKNQTLIVQKAIHILCNEVKNQLLSGLSSLQTPPSIATDCPATAPGGSLEMWVCGKVKRILWTEKRQNYAGQSKLVSIEQLSCSLTEVWGQTTKQLEKQLRFFFYFVCINV